MRKRLFVSFVILLFLLMTRLTAQSLGYVNLNHGAYELIDEAYALDALPFVSMARPYTKRQTIDLLSKMETAALTDLQTELRQYYIDQLSADSSGFIEVEQDNSRLAISSPVTLGVAANTSGFKNTIPSLSQSLKFSLEFGSNLYIGVDQMQIFQLWAWDDLPYAHLQEPVKFDNVFHGWNLQDGSQFSNTNSFHNPGDQHVFYASNQESQVTIGILDSILNLGRSNLNWGPGKRAAVHLSGSSKPYENISLILPIGNVGSFSWVTGFLQEDMPLGSDFDGKRMMNAHRLEFQPLSFMTVSIYETVLYSNRFELGYLNPIGLYFLNEVRLGDYDNKLGGIDLHFRFSPIHLYGSFFVDDWTFSRIFSLNYFNNQFAFLGGIEWVNVIPDLNAAFELTYMSHWIYTHRTDISAGVEHNFNNYTHFDSHLGHTMDQNSIAGEIFLDYDLSRNFELNFSTFLMFDGRGTIDDPPDWTFERELRGFESVRDIWYSFLDWDLDQFSIERMLQVELSGQYRFPETNLGLEARIILESRVNKDNVVDANEVTAYSEMLFTIR